MIDTVFRHPVLKFLYQNFLFPYLISVKRSLARNTTIIERYGRCEENGRMRRRNYHETNSD